MRRLVMRLCELGFLFKKVDAFSSSNSQRDGEMEIQSETGMEIDRASVNQHGCFTSQAFSYAVSKELSEYYRLMAVLESRASGQLQEESSQSKESSPDGPLTLRRLHVWLMEATRKMRILAVLIDSISHLKGGALASALYAHSRTGPILDVVTALKGTAMDCRGSICSQLYYETPEKSQRSNVQHDQDMGLRRRIC